MEPTSKNRFDANFVAQILLGIVHEQSLEKLLQKLVERVMEVRVTGKRLEPANQRLERELAERKEAEERLGQSEQRHRGIVDTASEGLGELDEDYQTTYVNQRMAEMLGYEPEEMAGRTWLPCFVQQGEPFARSLWMRRHRPREGLWL